jgi:starch synthase
MGCATAVLGSAVGGIPEVVADGITGALVEYSSNHERFESDLREAIIDLMRDPELLMQYGKAGRIRAQSEFDWDAVAESTIALYAQVLSR